MEQKSERSVQFFGIHIAGKIALVADRQLSSEEIVLHKITLIVI